MLYHSTLVNTEKQHKDRKHLEEVSRLKANGVRQLREGTLFFHFVTFKKAWLKVEGSEKSISIQGHTTKAVRLNKGAYLGGVMKHESLLLLTKCTSHNGRKPFVCLSTP